MAAATTRAAEPVTELIYSNVRGIVEQQQYLFETLWSKAIPAEDRIYELEHGIESPFIETIRDPIEVQMVTILVIFSMANVFYRQIVVAGGMQLCKEAASDRNVKIRVLTPRDDRIDKIVQELLQEQLQEGKQQEQQQQNQDQNIALLSYADIITISQIYTLFQTIFDNLDRASDRGWLVLYIKSVWSPVF